MHLFYIPHIKTQTVTLSEEESKHALRVLRLNAGDQVVVVDGTGGYYQALIQDPHPKRCQLQITASQQQFGYRPFQIQVAIAPPKSLDRTEWFIEKATEIGMDEVFFLACERSERKQINLERLEKIVISAMKQSVKAYKPRLHEMQPYQDFVAGCNPEQTYIAHLEEHDRQALHQIAVPEKCCILIGPEGDFSPKEITLAYQKGIQAVTLGNSRLRTETAALVACHTLHLLHEMK
jgi:16S rRNA (uracil1498-N3)-methyltransferase